MKTVDELRKELVELGVEESVVNKTKGKANLLALFGKVDKVDQSLDTELDIDLDQLEAVDTKEDSESVEDKPDVSYLSPEWDDYVMSHFLPKELTDGCPNVHGLRRVTELLLGPIVKSIGTGTTVCNYVVEIIWNRDFEGLSGLGNCGNRQYSGIASANEENTDHPFSLYLEANAETRAEVRALRKALRIKTVGAEEIKREHTEVEMATNGFDNSGISSAQSSFITNRCKLLKIDVDKFVATTGKEDIKELTGEEALGLIEDLNKFQTGNKEISDEIKETN